MIAYRLFGGGVILLAGLCFYYIRENFQKKKLIQLASFINLLGYIKNQISYYLLPIDKILCNCDKKIIADCGLDVSSNTDTLKEMLDKCEFYLEDEIQKKLYSFARDFGMGYSNEQIKLCDQYISELKSILDNFKLERLKDKKLSLAICISISLSLILVLL